MLFCVEPAYCAVSCRYFVYFHRHTHTDTDLLFFWQINRDELIRLMKESTENLLWQYVKMQGQRLTSIVRAGVEPVDWMAEKEPREVRMVRAHTHTHTRLPTHASTHTTFVPHSRSLQVISLLMDSLESIEKEVEQIYPSRKCDTPHQTHTTSTLLSPEPV